MAGFTLLQPKRCARPERLPLRARSGRWGPVCAADVRGRQARGPAEAAPAAEEGRDHRDDAFDADEVTARLADLAEVLIPAS